jgi:hypothetical protein
MQIDAEFLAIEPEPIIEPGDRYDSWINRIETLQAAWEQAGNWYLADAARQMAEAMRIYRAESNPSVGE